MTLGEAERILRSGLTSLMERAAIADAIAEHPETCKGHEGCVSAELLRGAVDDVEETARHYGDTEPGYRAIGVAAGLNSRPAA